VQPGAGRHRVFPAASDVLDNASHILVTAYALQRPDGQWSLLVINKDQENDHRVRIAFDDGVRGAPRGFSGATTIVSFGSAQYRWHANGTEGLADPDGPATRTSVEASPDTWFDLPAASISVIRGTLATSPARATRTP